MTFELDDGHWFTQSLDVCHFDCLLLNLVIHIAYLLPILQTKDLIIRSTSIQLLDHLSEGIKTRFDAPGFKIVQVIEEILLKASHGVIPKMSDLSGHPFSPNELRRELETLAALKASPAHLRDIASVVVQRKVSLPNTFQLMRLLYTVHMSNFTSERSFSPMKRVKSATRSLSGQERLNSLMLLSSAAPWTPSVWSSPPHSNIQWHTPEWWHIRSCLCLYGVCDFVFQVHEQLSFFWGNSGEFSTISFRFCWKFAERCVHVSGWHLWNYFSIEPCTHSNVMIKNPHAPLCLSLDEAR